MKKPTRKVSKAVAKKKPARKPTKATSKKTPARKMKKAAVNKLTARNAKNLVAKKRPARKAKKTVGKKTTAPRPKNVVAKQRTGRGASARRTSSLKITTPGPFQDQPRYAPHFHNVCLGGNDYVEQLEAISDSDSGARYLVVVSEEDRRRYPELIPNISHIGLVVHHNGGVNAVSLRENDAAEWRREYLRDEIEEDNND
jgi:hypothetical protein